mgnify:CR=1 FL=1
MSSEEWASFLCIGMGFGGYVDDGFTFPFYWIAHAVPAVGGYTTCHNLVQVANKRLTGAWLYPVFYEAEAAVGPRWAFWAVATPVSLFYCGLGALALVAAR